MKKITWSTKKRLVKKLQAYEKNPRKITEEQRIQLTASLKKFNLVEIPAINTDGTIIAGHQRIKILIALGRGEEEIDVRVPNRKLTDDEFKEYNLRSNKNTGEWDFDFLGEFGEELLNDVGFTDEEIDAYGDSDEEKARMRAKGEAYFRAHGVVASDPQSYCALGRKEIQKGSRIGSLLREK